MLMWCHNRGLWTSTVNFGRDFPSERTRKSKTSIRSVFGLTELELRYMPPAHQLHVIIIYSYGLHTDISIMKLKPFVWVVLIKLVKMTFIVTLKKQYLVISSKTVQKCENNNIANNENDKLVNMLMRLSMNLSMLTFLRWICIKYSQVNHCTSKHVTTEHYQYWLTVLVNIRTLAFVLICPS